MAKGKKYGGKGESDDVEALGMPASDAPSDDWTDLPKPAKAEEHKPGIIDRALDAVRGHRPEPAKAAASEHHGHEHIGKGHQCCPIGATSKAAADVPGKHRKYL